MNNKGMTYLRAPGKLIQVGVTVGQTLHRSELDTLRLAAVSQWPQIMRNRTESAQDITSAVEKAKHYPDGVICLYLQITNVGKRSLYLEYLNVNLLDSMTDMALIEKSREQIPLLCWLLQKQPNAATGWENLTTTTIVSGAHIVDGFGAARLSPTASFAPWGSAIVTAESVFPDLLADPSIAEKDYLIYLQTSKLFEQLERTTTTKKEDEIPILWSQTKQNYDESSINIVSGEDEDGQSRRKMLIGVAAAVVVSFIGSWMISNSTRAQGAIRVSPPEVQREMKFFLWNRPAAKVEPKATPIPTARVLPVTAKPAVEVASPSPKPEDTARRRAEALQALGLGQTNGVSEEEKRKEALQALTNGK